MKILPNNEMKLPNTLNYTIKKLDAKKVEGIKEHASFVI